MKKRREGLAIVALLVACTFWGSTFLLGKFALVELTVSQVVLYRFTIATLALLPIVLFRRSWPARRDVPLFLLTGLMAVPVSFLLQFGGLALTTVSSAALIVGIEPLLLAVGASWFFKERLTRLGWAAVGVSSVGVAILVGFPGPGHDWFGDFLVFLSLVTVAAWVLLNKKLLETYSALVSTAYVLAFGTLMLVPFSLWWDGPPPIDLSGGVWLSALGLGLAATALAFTLWNWALEHMEASRAGVFVNLEPVIGVALGVTVLHETLGAGAIVGGALILGSAVLISLPVASAQPAGLEREVARRAERRPHFGYRLPVGLSRPTSSRRGPPREGARPEPA